MSLLSLTPLPLLLQGNTGVLLGLLLVSSVILVALITVLSGIGVAEHGGIGSGGVYSMISSVLGGQMGGTVGLLYVFGQVRPQLGSAPHLCHSFAIISSSPFLVCPRRGKGGVKGPTWQRTTLGSEGERAPAIQIGSLNSRALVTSAS